MTDEAFPSHITAAKRKDPAPHHSTTCDAKHATQEETTYWLARCRYHCSSSNCRQCDKATLTNQGAD